MKKIVLLCLGFWVLQSCGSDKSRTAVPGQYDDYVLLPNGWRLTPTGESIPIDELPLRLVLTPDAKYAFTCNSGYTDNSVSVVDLQKRVEVQRVILDKAWVGMAYAAETHKLYVSGGNNDCVYGFDFRDGKLTRSDSLALRQNSDEKISVSGVEVLPESDLLLVVAKGSKKLYVYDLQKRAVQHTVDMGSECYGIELNHSKTFAYISLWGGARIAEIDMQDFTMSRSFAVGDHPCDIVITRDDQYLFTANANNNTTSVVDLVAGKEIERLNSSLRSDAPYGSTPNALAFDADESTLFVANADNNYLALFDVTEKGHSRSKGFIPTGWYPTAIGFSPGNNTIIVANGKGGMSLPNPRGPRPGERGFKPEEYIGGLFKGTVAVIALPDRQKLDQYSAQVYRNTPYMRQAAAIAHRQTVIPDAHTEQGSTAIKYVFYIIKENRTYDQIFGDLTQGNGDSSLCLFGQKVTPNHHKLATEFTLFDNFYVDAEVSADGHNWSTAAYATDYTEKTWPTLYGRRGGEYDFEGGHDIAAPASGYIWDAVLRKSLLLRNYGEYTHDEISGGDTVYVATTESLKPHTCQTFCGWDLQISDLTRLRNWRDEFDRFEQEGRCPNLNIIRLPNDHTAGTRAGELTPRAYVAQNDYALGLMVERISNSQFWPQSIIFVVEDDAQNGADHVDAHRSVLLAISPFVKRGFVDHTMYSTSSVLKTIELILGLPPMTQFDLAANPILTPLQDTPDTAPYVAIAPLLDLTETNKPDAYGALRSAQMDLDTEDAIPDVEFSEIVWKSIKGAASPMPAPVHSAFVKINESDD